MLLLLATFKQRQAKPSKPKQIKLYMSLSMYLSMSLSMYLFLGKTPVVVFQGIRQQQRQLPYLRACGRVPPLPPPSHRIKQGRTGRRRPALRDQAVWLDSRAGPCLCRESRGHRGTGGAGRRERLPGMGENSSRPGGVHIRGPAAAVFCAGKDVLPMGLLLWYNGGNPNTDREADP